MNYHGNKEFGNLAVGAMLAVIKLRMQKNGIKLDDLSKWTGYYKPKISRILHGYVEPTAGELLTLWSYTDDDTLCAMNTAIDAMDDIKRMEMLGK